MKIIAWRCHFHSKELTDEVAQAAAELDSQKRVELYHKMQQQAWDQSPIVFMLQQEDVAMARENIVDFHLGPQSDFVRYDKTRKLCVSSLMSQLARRSWEERARHMGPADLGLPSRDLS